MSDWSDRQFAHVQQMYDQQEPDYGPDIDDLMYGKYTAFISEIVYDICDDYNTERYIRQDEFDAQNKILDEFIKASSDLIQWHGPKIDFAGVYDEYLPINYDECTIFRTDNYLYKPVISCPKCGRFMNVVDDMWVCSNGYCGHQEKADMDNL